jgi:hypothetical protein
MPGLLLNFGQFSCSWIRIRISNKDPDPGQPSQCESIRIRIHNTVNNTCTGSAAFFHTGIDVLYPGIEDECLVQLGGSDQMGNMAAGQELISRHQDAQVDKNILDKMFRPGSGAWRY